MKPQTPPRLKKLPPTKQQRMDELLDRNREGVITAAEKAKLHALVADAEQLMVENAKRLAAFHEQEASEAPSGATPVTIWVKASPVGR
ncbi:MAG: hypothetical protein HYY23_17900 [Verrucomicrobia bacterium]|nr:hypothetical protein [Verrucomicrobiota bacterium]